MNAPETNPEQICVGFLNPGFPNGTPDSSSDTCALIRGQFKLKNAKLIDFRHPRQLDSRRLVDFVQRTFTGGVDLVILRTAAGLKRILSAATAAGYRDRIVDAFCDIDFIVTSKEAELVAGQNKISVRLLPAIDSPGERIADNESWRQLLIALDGHTTLLNRTVAIETGSNVHSLAAGLAARGASVLRIDPFAATPAVEQTIAKTTGDKESNLLFDVLSRDNLNVLVFPDAATVGSFVQQTQQFLEDPQHETDSVTSVLPGRLKSKVRHLLDGVCVMAIGDDTATIVLDRIPVNRTLPSAWSVVTDEKSATDRIEMIYDNWDKRRKAGIRMNSASIPLDTNNDPASKAPWHDSPFLKACRGEPVDVTPVWMMRQAGRYMAEYREVRAKISFLDLCANPQLCSEVMCTAVEKLGVDAAIIFSDLLPILVPMGCDLEFAKGDGPKIHNPVRTSADLDRIKPLDNNDELMFVMETVAQTRKDLPSHIPLIGFAGAPFTLASYMIEGGSSRNYAHTKHLMYTDPGAWHELMQRLSTSIAIYLRGQVDYGAQCLQIFDSWAGCLSVRDYRRFALPYVKQIVESIPPHIPVINFATGNPALLPMLAEAGSAVVGIDWRVNLDEAWQTVGHDRSVQGNLDPTVLLTNPAEIKKQAAEILQQANGRPGHIFNLGHGILPQTPVENAIALVDAVHELSSK